MLNFVVINGGRGAGTLIPALLEFPGSNVTSIVNAYDDGKSTGEIRKFFDMLGPSDIRKVQELMLPKDDPDYDSNIGIFQYRFPENIGNKIARKEIDDFVFGSNNALCGFNFVSNIVISELRIYLKEFLVGLDLIEVVKNKQFSFQDCSIMNCIYAGAFLKHERNIETASIAIDKLFKLKGQVLPTSIENKKLVALRENGEMLYSEADIVELRSNVLIDRIFLLDQLLDKKSFSQLSIDQKKLYLKKHHCFVGISKRAKLALNQADIIIYSAGTQHSSLYPTYLSVGLAQSIADNSKALKVFITNIGADYETPTYKASDYIKGAYRYLQLSDHRQYSYNELFDYNLLNQSKNPGKSYVKLDKKSLDQICVPQVIEDFESEAHPGKHDGYKLLLAIHNKFESRA